MQGPTGSALFRLVLTECHDTCQLQLSAHDMVLAGGAPAPCHSHAAAVVQNQMIVFGGTSGYQETFSGLHALDLTTGHWETITLVAPTEHPPSCFSHSLTAVGGLLVLAGGCRTTGAGQWNVVEEEYCCGSAGVSLG